jgi:GNAT superfamily N-acetyltransferase
MSNEDRVTLRLLHGEAGEMRELQRVLEEAPGYAHRVTGLPPGNADAESTYSALPEGKSYDDKFVFGIYDGPAMVGCADVIRGYPNPATAMLGLLLVSERYQRRGIGRRAYGLLEQLVRGWSGCDRVRIGVVRTNEAIIPFWIEQGFAPTGEVRPYRYASVASEVLVFEKRLPDATADAAAAPPATVAGRPEI